jgi:sialidase-1
MGNVGMNRYTEIVVCPLLETGPTNLRNSEGAVIELRNGHLLLAYTHFYADADDYGAGDIRGKTSTDGGKTWSAPFMIEANTARFNVGRLALLRLAKRYDGSHHHPPLLGHVYVEFNGFYTTRILFKTSIDEGQTWSTPVQINDTGTLGHICTRGDTAVVLSTGRIVVPVYALFGGMCASFAYYSDDGGETWRRSVGEMSVKYRDGDQVTGFNNFEEPAVAELRDGRLLCFGRTNTGRIWQAFSMDDAVTWSDPEPTELASSYSPASLKTIPTTGDLLCVWNQAAPEEIPHGFGRMRMSCAVSKDDGKTWEHFKNLESLDDRSRITPPGIEGATDTQSEEFAINARKALAMKTPPHQASKEFTDRYPHFPGYCWNDYPSTTFISDGQVIITYGASDYETAGLECGQKLVVRPVDWLYED